MEKTNLEIVLKLLQDEPLKSGVIHERTSISRSSLSNILSNLIEDKMIKKVDGYYKIILPTPSFENILDKMIFYHQQKSSQYKYRKLSQEKKIDIITEWFIDTPTNLKGKIEDYIYEELLNNITKASTQLYHHI